MPNNKKNKIKIDLATFNEQNASINDPMAIPTNPNQTIAVGRNQGRQGGYGRQGGGVGGYGGGGFDRRSGDVRDTYGSNGGGGFDRRSGGRSSGMGMNMPPPPMQSTGNNDKFASAFAKLGVSGGSSNMPPSIPPPYRDDRQSNRNNIDPSDPIFAKFNKNSNVSDDVRKHSIPPGQGVNNPSTMTNNNENNEDSVLNDMHLYPTLATSATLATQEAGTPTVKTIKTKNNNDDGHNTISIEERKKTEEERKRKLKEEKRKAKEELAARLKKEEEDAAAEKQRLIDEAESTRAQSIQSGVIVYNTNKKGESLSSHISTLNNNERPSAGALTAAVLANLKSDTEKWMSNNEYGIALKTICEGNSNEQASLIFELQRYCHEKKFPKVNINNKERKLIEYWFEQLFINEIVDNEGFDKWCETGDDTAGKQNALFQTSEFITMINEEDDDEEEEEEEEMDLTRETV